MKYLNLFHCFLLAILASGAGFCTRDYFEGPEPRLLVKAHGAPDNQYADRCTIYLNGDAGATATVDVNTNYRWYVDDRSLYTVPNWCTLSLPGGILTGNVTDKTLTFIAKSDNELPFVRYFDLVLRHTTDPGVTVTIRVIQNIKGDVFEVHDTPGGARAVVEERNNNGVVNFSGSVHTVSFAVHSSRDWKMAITPTGINREEDVSEWITASLQGFGFNVATEDGFNLVLTPTDFDSVMEVVLSIDANESNRYSRTANIEILATTHAVEVNSIIIPIRQQTADPYVTITPFLGHKNWNETSNTIEVPALHPNNIASSFEVLVNTKSNREWTASISYEAAGDNWLSMNPTLGLIPFDAITDEVVQPVTFTVDPNPSLTQSRTAYVTITGNGLTETLTVVQSAKELVFNISATSIEFGASASGATAAQTFTITSNHPWSITGDAGSSGFTFGPMSASPEVNEETVSITVFPNNPNTDVNNPKVAIYTISYGNGQSAAITVTQKRQLPKLELKIAGALPKSKTIAIPGTFAIGHDVSTRPDWVGSIGLSGRTFTVSGTACNPDFDNPRSYPFIVRNAATGEDMYEVVIIQDKRWWIRIVGASGWEVGNGDRYPIPMPSADNPLEHTAISFTGNQGHNIANRVTFVLDGHIDGNSFTISYVRLRDDALIGGNKTLTFGIPHNVTSGTPNMGLTATPSTHPTSLSVPSSFTFQPSGTRAVTSQTITWLVTISVPNESDVKVTIYVKQYDELRYNEPRDLPYLPPQP
ncbi:MAG: hypothetical protein FWE30_03105 [Bacteroidales bacterium]|nr:hypothetical protein [Bacteroidales bacterium]